MDAPSPSLAERWLDIVCQFRYVLYIVLIVLFLFLVLAVASAVTRAPSSPETWTILVLDFIVLGFAISVTGGLLALCRWFRQ